MTLLALILAAYLMGSMPTGKLVVKRLKGVNIEDYGSGNIGAANVLRVAGLRASAAVLAVDILKGTLAVALARWLLASPLGATLVGLAAIAGHNWPAHRGFKGGKGVLTTLGCLFALAPRAGALSAITGGIVMVTLRYSSLGSLTGTIVGAAYLISQVLAGKKPPAYLVYALITPALVIATHRENIDRLLHGKENRLAAGSIKLGES